MGISQDHYNELHPEFSKIIAELFVKPFASVEGVTSYSDGIIHLINQHGTRIVDEGANSAVLDSLQKRVNAYAVAESNATNAVATTHNSADIWPVRKVEAQNLRADLLTYSEVAFESHPELLQKVYAIRSGQGNADLIHDMLDLSGLLRANPEPFTALKKFNPEWINRSEELFTELRDIRAVIDSPDERIEELETLEKQAYTYLDQAVQEVRRFGKLAFRNEPELLAVLKQNNRIN